MAQRARRVVLTPEGELRVGELAVRRDPIRIPGDNTLKQFVGLFGPASSPVCVGERLRVEQVVRLTGDSLFVVVNGLAIISRTLREESQPVRVLGGRLQLVGVHERGACTAEQPLALQYFSDQLRTRDTLRHGELRVGDRARRCFGFIGLPQAAFGGRERERDRRIVTNAERVAPGRRRFELVAVRAVAETEFIIESFARACIEALRVAFSQLEVSEGDSWLPQLHVTQRDVVQRSRRRFTLIGSQKLRTCCVPTLQLQQGEAEIQVDGAVIEARGYSGAPCPDALLGVTELRMQEAALPFDVSARCGFQRLSGRKIELSEFPALVTGFCVQFSNTYVPRSGMLSRRRSFELLGRGGVRPACGIQVA